MHWSRGAFAMVEAAACASVLGCACAVGAVATGQGRKNAGLAGSMANLQKIGETTGAFAADEADRLWSFDWSPGNCPSQYPDLQIASSETGALANQAVDIVRRRFEESQPKLSNRFVAPWLSTLMLVDYLDEALPAEWAVSPGDEVRLRWQADPHNAPELGEQGGVAWDALFAPFGSSYMLMPAFFAAEERVGNQLALSQYRGHHDLYSVPTGAVFGGRRVAEIAFPAMKVHMAERASFFFGPRTAYFLHREARLPVLMADGSAAARTGADANASFRPNDPENLEGTTTAAYSPNPLYDPPALSGSGGDGDVETHYKWTRRGLRGVDFNGERAE